jgi:hypothetical protein
VESLGLTLQRVSCPRGIVMHTLTLASSTLVDPHLTCAHPCLGSVRRVIVVAQMTVPIVYFAEVVFQFVSLCVNARTLRSHGLVRGECPARVARSPPSTWSCGSFGCHTQKCVPLHGAPPPRSASPNWRACTTGRARSEEHRFDPTLNGQSTAKVRAIALL